MDERKFNQAFEKINANQNLKNAAKSGNIDDVLKNLSPDQASMLNKILSDKKATEEILSSPQAAAIMKALFGNK
ncbi:MAG: hypothetical protein IKV36_05235 [Clostridia bacterium]|nr:hypothetical protein [Clostridia bacterium]